MRINAILIGGVGDKEDKDVSEARNLEFAYKAFYYASAYDVGFFTARTEQMMKVIKSAARIIGWYFHGAGEFYKSSGIKENGK